MDALRARLRGLDTTVIVFIALIAVLALSAVLVATAGRNLFSPGSIRDILTGMSVLGFVAIGQTLVILADPSTSPCPTSSASRASSPPRPWTGGPA
jgi:ribose transport system permease protein